METRRDTAAKTAGESRNGEEDRTTRDGQKGEGEKGKSTALTTSCVRQCTSVAFVLKACKFVAEREGSVLGCKRERDDEINVPKKGNGRGTVGWEKRWKCGYPVAGGGEAAFPADINADEYF